jgi:tetratricopeptide (TPR) repeat protein
VAERFLTFGPFRLDLLQSRLWSQAQPIALRPQAFAVLRYLVLHADRLVTKAELFQHVWDGRQVTDTVLRGCIHAIRVALADTVASPQYLETVGRLGYRFRLGRGATGLRQADARPVVGRQGEVEWLQERWMWAIEGRRQFGVLSGEAGIGKTTVVDLFVASLPKPHEVGVGWGQCVETYGDGEPYRPMLEALGQLGQSPHREALLSVLQRYAPTWLVQLPALLGDGERERLQRQLLGVTPARMLRELAEALEVLTRTLPLVLVLEDLHWSDVATVNVLTYLAQRREAARCLLLGTYRPADVVVREHPLRGVLQELRGRGLCDELALELLCPAEVETYVAARLDGEVTAELAALIYHRTEGNALFMVNMLEHLVEQGVVKQEGGQWTIGDHRTVTPSVPDALQLLITKRLEMLARAEQRVLEVASVVGDVFATAAVAAGLDVPVAHVDAICDTLGQQHAFLEPAGLEEWPDGTLSGCYRFQHTLYRQVLATRLGEIQRMQVHRRIGERLAQSYGPQTPMIATQLALHFVHGRAPCRAVQYLQQAGEQALHYRAYHEARRHFEAGLELLPYLPDTPERTRQEVALLLALGSVLMTTEGQAASEVLHTYRQAHMLCAQGEEKEPLFLALRGLTIAAYARGEHGLARDLAEQCYALAQGLHERTYVVEALRLLGSRQFLLGDYPAARQHYEQGLALYHRLAPLTSRGFSLGEVMASGLAMLALVVWQLGYPDQAQQRSAEALTFAQKHSDSFDFAITLSLTAILHHFRRDATAVYDSATRLLARMTELGFPLLRARATQLQGWAVAVRGDAEVGLAHLRQGAMQTTEMLCLQPFYLALQVEVYGMLQQYEAALHLLTHILTLAQATEQPFYDAELYRLKGELLLAQAGPRHPSDEAEASFHQALDVARRQATKMWELRAAVSLSRVWHQQGKSAEARSLLAPLYGWFTEGHETADLQAARALLERLS